jgi:glycosyltransferase involved in cell wall biosynthesis
MVDTSVVISAFNEEENLEELYGELTRVMEGLGVTYEVLFVDDGSTDRTRDLLRKFYESDGHVRVVRFGRNYGQQAANAAGLRLARGKVIIIIDADLQTPPSEIPKLREKLLEGHDIVYGVRRHPPTSLYRRLGTIGVNWLIRRVIRLDLPDGATSFLAIDRKLVDEVNQFTEKTRYLSGYLAWLSYGRYASVPVERRARKHGKSKYTFRRLVDLAVTLVAHYSTAPLAIASYLGLLLILGGAVVLVFGLISRGFASPGNVGSFVVPVIGAVVLFAGVQLGCVGILGEYIGRVYNEVRARPGYVIRETLDHAAGASDGQGGRANEDGNDTATESPA